MGWTLEWFICEIVHNIKFFVLSWGCPSHISKWHSKLARISVFQLCLRLFFFAVFLLYGSNRSDFAVIISDFTEIQSAFWCQLNLLNCFFSSSQLLRVIVVWTLYPYRQITYGCIYAIVYVPLFIRCVPPHIIQHSYAKRSIFSSHCGYSLFDLTGPSGYHCGVWTRTPSVRIPPRPVTVTLTSFPIRLSLGQKPYTFVVW